jgi:hypothetical protein
VKQSTECGLLVRAGVSLLGVVLIVAVVSGCPTSAVGGSDESEGGLTVTLSGATTVPDGSELVIEVLTQPSDWHDQAPEATGRGTVSGGIASVEAELPGTDTAWIGTGGTTYDVYVYIDENDNSRLDPGEWKYADNPITYTQDGDHVVPTVPAEYEEWTLIIL